MEHKGLLDIHHLCVRYPYGDEVLHDVSLHMHSKEIVCVIGESGCGKSTLLNAVLRMPGRVDITQGKILYRDRDLCTMPVNELRQLRGARIGMVFQEPGASLDPIRKISTQFYETIRAHQHIKKKEALTQAALLLLKLDFADPERILKSCPVQLSGGMNQRVAIALAMALRPDILLADEPTSALDVTVQAQIVEELLRLRTEFGTGILLVTHNIDIVSRMADKVAVMYEGRIVEFGYRESVLQAPAHPYTRALMSAIPKLDGTPPVGIPGRRPKKPALSGCAFMPRCPYAESRCAKQEMSCIPVHGEHWTLCNAGLKGGC